MTTKSLHQAFCGTDQSYSVFVPLPAAKTPGGETSQFFGDILCRSGDHEGDRHALDPFVGHIQETQTPCDEVRKHLKAISIVPLREILNGSMGCDAELAVAIQPYNAGPVSPSKSSVVLEEYPFSQRLYLYTTRDKAEEREVQDFIKYSLSSPGQQILALTGIGAAEPAWVDPWVPEETPAYYRALAKTARRFSLAFRFQDAQQLEEKAKEDLGRFKDFIFTSSGSSRGMLYVVGFAGQRNEMSSMAANRTNDSCQKSLALATVVKDELRSSPDKMPPFTVVGFGDALPIGLETGEEGLARNDRVEIWDSAGLSPAGIPPTCPAQTAGGQ